MGFIQRIYLKPNLAAARLGTIRMDKYAFQNFYQQHRQYVFAIVQRHLPDAEQAKDIVQEVFLDLWLKRDRLGTVREIKPYLYVTARNQVISAFRRKSIQQKSETLLLTKHRMLDDSAEELTFAKELHREINVIVARMPGTIRRCYCLSKNEGKKNGEIARILRISEKTVRNHVSEALQKLRLRLSENHPGMFSLLLFSLHLYLIA